MIKRILLFFGALLLVLILIFLTQITFFRYTDYTEDIEEYKTEISQ